MQIYIETHARERAKEKGSSEDEVIATIYAGIDVNIPKIRTNYETSNLIEVTVDFTFNIDGNDKFVEIAILDTSKLVSLEKQIPIEYSKKG